MARKLVLLHIEVFPRRLQDVIAKAERSTKNNILLKKPGITPLGGGTGSSGPYSPWQNDFGGFGVGGFPTCIPTPKRQYELMQSGSSYINEFGGDIGDVYMDFLHADPSQYDLTGNVVTPYASLIPGTIVTAELV